MSGIAVTVLENAFVPINSGTATIDFGAFPGSGDTSLAVTGQTLITSDSLPTAWLSLTAATADHTTDEHFVDPPDVFAGNIVPGVGFTIYARAKAPPARAPDYNTHIADRLLVTSSPVTDPQPYGQWTVQWLWM